MALACLGIGCAQAHTVSIDATRCASNGQLYHGWSPSVLDHTETRHDFEICFEDFDTLYSGETKTPLWSAEHLYKRRVRAAHHLRRLNEFHAEDDIPVRYRSELSDYRDSGYDRGHMAPAADMPNREAEDQSFSLVNMVPQNHENNAGLWEGIEVAVRDMAWHGQDVYVVTGPIFRGQVSRIRGGVEVPEYMFKAVYDATTGKAGAYIAPNRPGDQYSVVSVHYLEAISGVDAFPELPVGARDHAADLPTPRPQRHVLPLSDRVPPSDLEPG